MRMSVVFFSDEFSDLFVVVEEVGSHIMEKIKLALALLINFSVVGFLDIAVVFVGLDEIRSLGGELNEEFARSFGIINKLIERYDFSFD